MKIEPLQITVKSLSWFMNPHGYLIGLLHFDPITYMGEESEQFVFGMTMKFQELGVVPGCTIYFEPKKFPHGTMLAPVRVDHAGQTEYPPNCLVCGQSFAVDKHGHCCTNELCDSLDFTTLYRFMEAGGIPVGLTVDQVRDFVTNYPDKDGEKSKISDLFSLVNLMKQTEPLMSQQRFRKLTELYGAPLAVCYSAMENAVSAVMTNGFTPSQFWKVASIPKLSADGLAKLGAINPKLISMRQLDEAQVSAADQHQIKFYLDKWRHMMRFLKIQESS